MTQDQILVYPTIFEENTDDPSGYYYTVTSPNIDGMVIEGTTRAEAALMAVDAIATMLDGEVYPPAQDPSDWQLAANESIVYITVNMTEWLREKALYRARERKVRMNIMVPISLRDAARKQGINVSKVATEALAQLLG